MTLLTRPLLAGLLAVSSSAQTTWFVDASAAAPGNGSSTQPFTTIQAGFNASASAGDTVRVLSGTYTENLVLDGKSVELTAASGLGSVIVDGDSSGPALTIESHPAGSLTVVRGMRFQNGLGTEVLPDVRRGGGLYVPGPASTAFESCEFMGNTADEGGGAYLNGGSYSFVSCAFNANFADVGGGLYAAGVELVLQASSVADNQGVSEPFTGGSARRGAGIALLPPTGTGAPAPTTLIEDCDVSRNVNVIGANGAGMYLNTGGVTTVRHTSVTGNGRTVPGQYFGSGGSGGGISAGPLTTLENCQIRDNGARLSRGGGISGSCTVRNCVIAGNNAADGGGAFGGIFEDCLFEGNSAGGLCCAEGALGGGAHSATLTRCVLRSNISAAGPVLLGAGAFACELQDCIVEYNFTNASGANPFNDEGGGLYACTAEDTIIRYNSATAGGGASQCSGPVHSLTRCTIVGNVAFESGGGTTVSTLRDCTISGNHAGGHGGAAVESGLERCVVFGNTASVCGGTAGCSINFCTVTGNRASDQIGGVGSSDEFLPPFLALTSTTTNSIVYANTPDNLGVATGDGPGFPTANAEWSLIQGGWPGTGNIDADGLVTGPFSGNAQLLAGSPGIDTADPAAPLDPDGSRADMGAIPFDPTFVPEPSGFCVGKASSLGIVPQIGWSGSAALSGPDNFELLGTDLNGDSFALVAIAPNPATTQAFGGTICVGQGLMRLGVLPTGSTTGTADGAVAIGLSQAQLAGYGAGALLYAQILVRDPGNPDGSGAALTAGLEFRIIP